MRIKLFVFVIFHCALLYSSGIDERLKSAHYNLYENPKYTETVCIELIDSLDKNNPQNYASIMDAYMLIGGTYDLQGYFDIGILYMIDALAFCENNDIYNKALINNRLAGLYNCLFDDQKASQYNDDALKYYVALNNSSGVADCYNIQGLIYVNNNEYHAADSVFQLALDIYRSMNQERKCAVILNNMSLYDGNPTEKISFLKEAIAINNRNNRVWSLGENYNNLGLQYFYNGQYKEAIKALEVAYEYGQKTDAKELISDNLRYKSWVYDRLGIYDKAYANSVESGEIERQIQSDANARNIDRMLAKSQLARKKTQISLLKEKHKTEVMYNALFCFITGVVLLIIALYTLYRKKKIKQIGELYRTRLELQETNARLLALKLEKETNDKMEMESQLGISTRDLTAFSEYINNRNDLFDKIRGHIKSTYHNDREGIVKELKKVINMINKYLKMDDSDANMSKQVDQYGDGFLDRLEELHPGMSKTEKKMASYLRLGMSTKDICLITDSNIKAVNMARYRLRKHLQLDSDVSITEYLQSIV